MFVTAIFSPHKDFSSGFTGAQGTVELRKLTLQSLHLHIILWRLQRRITLVCVATTDHKSHVGEGLGLVKGDLTRRGDSWLCETHSDIMWSSWRNRSPKVLGNPTKYTQNALVVVKVRSCWPRKSEADDITTSQLWRNRQASGQLRRGSVDAFIPLPNLQPIDDGEAPQKLEWSKSSSLLKCWKQLWW